MFSITCSLITACLMYHTAYAFIYEVVGGIDAPDGKYPYQVSLKDAVTGKHFCGGAIVSQKYVITAAHCLDGMARL
ncbi:PREDICTED: chymotrypsin-2-like [Cyphomyrmex costatus]|uniref:chymotrypsin-2-like n=1 Tax=Cyphomyrmex costatus TaxID=456900 RepID=UPI000852465D|nr:PREDICTED: chymotrypsin-2-like [Cyphomyrmex costatus]